MKMDTESGGPLAVQDQIKLQELELEVLTALDDLRKAEDAATCEDATSNLTSVEGILCLRSRCESAERCYSTALKELGFAPETWDLLTEPLCSELNTTSLTVSSGHGVDHSDASGNALSPAAADHAQANGGGVLDACWDCERKKLETLMMSLRSSQVQNPLLCLWQRCEEERSFASKSYQVAHADAETAGIMSGYKLSLHRTAKLLIELDGLYAQLDQIRTATGIDMQAAAVLRAEIERCRDGTAYRSMIFMPHTKD